MGRALSLFGLACVAFAAGFFALVAVERVTLRDLSEKSYSELKYLREPYVALDEDGTLRPPDRALSCRELAHLSEAEKRDCLRYAQTLGTTSDFYLEWLLQKQEISRAERAAIAETARERSSWGYAIVAFVFALIIAALGVRRT